MVDQRIVFVDVESIGLDPNGPIRQIAAVAVNGDLQEIEAFNIRMKVDWRDIRWWQRDRRRRVPRPRPAAEQTAARQFAEFLRRHATLDLSMSSRKSLRVAQLAAHQAAHDGPFLHAFFERNRKFFPGRYQMFCTLQRALWFFHENPALVPPPNVKLATLCHYFGVPFDPAAAHDALYDARATVALYVALLTHCQEVPSRDSGQAAPARLQIASRLVV
jgi:hypothetical protein